MIEVKSVQVVAQATAAGERVLGAVVSAEELELLQGEESAMPVGAYLRQALAAVDSATGAVYVMGDRGVKEPLRSFVVATYHAKAAERDAAIAELHPEVRAEIAGPAWEPEATKIERRTQEAREAREKAEAARAEVVKDAAPVRGGK